MAPALIATLALAVSYPPPVASFTTPSVVGLGQEVSYVDHSFDPAPGHSIVLTIWIGRQGAFYSTGPHTVSLAVEDDRGLWGQTSRTIVVRAAARRRAPSAELSASPSTVHRGDPVHLTLTAPRQASDLRLTLPASFTPQVSLPSGTIRYAAINDASWSFSDGAWHATIWVPWTAREPHDGSYTVEVEYAAGKETASASTTVRVQGTDRLGLWRL